MSTKQTDNQAIRQFLLERIQNAKDVTACLGAYSCGQDQLEDETEEEHLAHLGEIFNAFILRMLHLLTRCHQASTAQLSAWLTLMPESAPPESASPERLQAIRLDLAAMLGLRVVAGR